MPAPCEAWFYHLERSRMEDVLPELLEKSLARGWKAMVLTGDPTRLAPLDERLWTYRDESFLPHGVAGERDEQRQPILLTSTAENRNGAEAIFLVDGAQTPNLSAYIRCFDLFDGRDDAAVADARKRWTAVKAQGANPSYWTQSEAGPWTKRA